MGEVEGGESFVRECGASVFGGEVVEAEAVAVAFEEASADEEGDRVRIGTGDGEGGGFIEGGGEDAKGAPCGAQGFGEARFAEAEGLCYGALAGIGGVAVEGAERTAAEGFQITGHAARAAGIEGEVG